MAGGDLRSAYPDRTHTHTHNPQGMLGAANLCPGSGCTMCRILLVSLECCRDGTEFCFPRFGVQDLFQKMVQGSAGFRRAAQGRAILRGLGVR